MDRQNITAHSTNILCTNVFKSASEEEKKRRFIRLWIEMINLLEKTKYDPYK